jgi:hypothetical protein
VQVIAFLADSISWVYHLLDRGIGLRGGVATSAVAWMESLRLVTYSSRLSGVGFWLRRVQ